MIREVAEHPDGPILEAVLTDGPMRVALLSLGGITRDWQVETRAGPHRAILGFRNAADYMRAAFYPGAICGRVANRIGGARFRLGGKEYRLTRNEGENHLHGGARGLTFRLWDVEADGRSAEFTYVSPDGEEGYPGEVGFRLRMTLEAPRLIYQMWAEADRETPVNLAQHNYYTLGTGEVWDQRLRIPADKTTVNGPGLIPTGALGEVAGTPHDFRAGRTIAEADPARAGLDGNYVLEAGRDPAAPVAELSAPEGLRLRMWSDQPCVQLFTAPGLAEEGAAWPGQRFAPFHAVCLEPQVHPDAVNRPEFPSVLIAPDRPYYQRTVVEITEAEE